MTSIFRAIKEKRILQEQPTMEKPKWDYGFAPDGPTNSQLLSAQQDHDDMFDKYNEHLASLRSIPYRNENDFEENKDYEEGKDFEIEGKFYSGIYNSICAVCKKEFTGADRLWFLCPEHSIRAIPIATKAPVPAEEGCEIIIDEMDIENELTGADNLLRCPFCGNNPVIHGKRNKRTNNIVYTISCPGLECTASVFCCANELNKARNSAIKKWNNRSANSREKDAATTEELKADNLRLQNQLADAKAENERLRLLIKEGFILLQQHWGKTVGQIDNDWKKFCEENNL